MTDNIYSFAAAKAKRDEANPTSRFGEADPAWLASLDWQTVEIDLPPELAQFLADGPPKP